MKARKRKEGLWIFCMLAVFCLMDGQRVPAEELLPLRTARFTEKRVLVNVDGRQFTENSVDDDGNPTVHDYGICPYVEVSIAGENDYTDLADSLSGVIPENVYMYGYHFGSAPYHRMNFGKNAEALTGEISGEDTVFPWHLLWLNSTPPVPVPRNILVTDRQNRFSFDGRYFREQFSFFYRNKAIYITSGMAMRASVYTGSNQSNATDLFREWFRASYNHNYEVRYDYGFVNAEARGLSPEKGTLVENLCYFALPKQLMDPEGSSRYQFLGWCLSCDGTDYVPAQGEEQAVYKFGIPETTSAVMTSALEAEESGVSFSAEMTMQIPAERLHLPMELVTGSNLQQNAE